MARLVSTGLIAALSALSSAAYAFEPSDSPWSVAERSAPARAFSIAPHEGTTRSNRDGGTRMIAGKRIMPNGTIGIGFLGRNSASPSLAPVTVRDMAIPKQRKAAIGFSLKF